MESNFNNDLKKVELLNLHLDVIYKEKFKGFNIERVNDKESQHKGIDLIISKNGVNYNIDEKAQLDYLNKDLPTFAFEISYLKNNSQKQGWLLDESKTTDRYFLITSIYLNDISDIEKGFKSCKILSVDRTRLLKLLTSKGLDYKKLSEINQNIRNGMSDNAIKIDELDYYSEGKIYYSKSNKAEQPINLVLYLDFLIKTNVAKKII